MGGSHRCVRISLPPFTLSSGASEGIGLAFARSCAKRGINVVLVARREAVLRERCTEIEREHPTVTAIPVVADALEPTTFADRVSAATQNLTVSVLINSLGGDAGQSMCVWEN